jgi:hypothetical protein
VTNPVENERRNNLALMKMMDNHKVDIDELQLIVEMVLNTTSGSRSVGVSERAVITGVKRLPLEEQRFTSNFIGRSVATESYEEPVAVYEFAVGSPEDDNEMFVLASDDIRIGNILAIAQGSLEDTPGGFYEILQVGLHNYITETILEYENITDEEVAIALENAATRQPEAERSVNGGKVIESDFTIKKRPMLKTRWGQGEEGGWSGEVYNNYVQHVYGNFNFIAGCGPTAIAQIIAYHNHIIPPNSPALPKSFDSNNYGKWSGAFNLSKIRNMETINYSKRMESGMMEAIGQVGVLMYYIGHKSIGNATYKPEETSMSLSGARSAFQKLGYTVTNYDTKPTTVTGTTSSFSIKYNTSLAVIKKALNDNRPIFFGGDAQSGSKKTGHWWVIDGWADMTYYREVRADNSTWRVSLNNILMVHCNLGWDGKSDGWYIYGLFITSSPFYPDPDLDVRSVTAGNKNYSLNTEMLIPKK